VFKLEQGIIGRVQSLRANELDMAFKFVMSYFGHDCLRNQTCFCNEAYFLFNEIIKAMVTLKWATLKQCIQSKNNERPEENY
jgi:hypothetical protein